MGIKNKINMESLLLSFILMIGVLNSTLNYSFNISSNSNLYLLLVELFMILVIICFHNKLTIKFSKLTIFISIMIIALYIVSYIRNPGIYPIGQLLFFCLIPLFSFSRNINAKLVLEYCMWLSLLSVFCLNGIFSVQYEGINQISMGSTYGICVSIVAAVIHFFLYYKESSKGIKALYLYQLFLLIKVINVGNRGAILEVILTFIVMFISPFRWREEKEKHTLKKIMIMWILMIGIIIIFLNLDGILIFLNKLCINLFGSAPSFLIKSNSLLESGNLNNNRTKLYNDALNLILREPIAGYGMRTFSLYTIFPWPHNLFIQLIFDGGIFFFIPMTLLIIIMIKEVILSKFNRKNDYAISIFLLLMVFPRLFVSNDIWITPFLWCLLGYTTFYITKKKSRYYYERKW